MLIIRIAVYYEASHKKSDRILTEGGAGPFVLPLLQLIIPNNIPS